MNDADVDDNLDHVQEVSFFALLALINQTYIVCQPSIVVVKIGTEEAKKGIIHFSWFLHHRHMTARVVNY